MADDPPVGVMSRRHQIFPELTDAEITRILMNIAKLDRVDMATKPQNPDLPRLQELATAQPDRLELATEGPDIASRIGRCHVAITSGSSLSLELACVACRS